MIAIVDYGVGNLASVLKACQKLGASAQLTDRPDQIHRAQGVIFPGVGTLGAAVKELKRRRLMGPLRQSIQENKPFLGLCLGLQLLFEESQESPGVKGLGIFSGKVKRFCPRSRLKIPHMGWNQIQKSLSSGKENPLLRGIPNGAFMYFVHSYYADLSKRSRLVSAWTDYSRHFPSVIWDGQKVWATQFHPEKSQRWGLKLLKNFLGQVRC